MKTANNQFYQLNNNSFSQSKRHNVEKCSNITKIEVDLDIIIINVYTKIDWLLKHVNTATYNTRNKSAQRDKRASKQQDLLDQKMKGTHRKLILNSLLPQKSMLKHMIVIFLLTTTNTILSEIRHQIVIQMRHIGRLPQIALLYLYNVFLKCLRIQAMPKLEKQTPS